MKLSILKFILLLLFILQLIACGTGEEGTIDGSGFGTVATGAPVINTDVIIKGSNGKIITTKTDANGKYFIDRKGQDFSTPYLIKVPMSDTKTLYSIGQGERKDDIRANVHPLTDFILRNWFASKGRDIDTEFNAVGEITSPPVQSDIESVSQSLKKIMATTFSQFNISPEFDFLSSEFDANSTGFDKLLDFTQVINQNNNFTIKVTDPVTQVQATLIEGFDITVDITSEDEQSPTRPEIVKAVAASDTSILLTWASSTDNISIAGYNVYKNDAQITTVAFPTFTDGNLSSSTEHCYEIEAFDGSGNKSTKTLAECATTLENVDETAPAAVTVVQIIAETDASIKLTWPAVNETDVAGYRIYEEIDGSPKAIASVVDTQFIVLGLNSDTNYCYQVRAFDGAGNESAQIDFECTNTLLEKPSGPPEKPTNLTATSSETSIKLQWSALSDENFLDGYRIYRNSDDQTLEKIATVQATVFADQNLQASNQYCYVIKAVNIDGIESEATEQTCASALDNNPPTGDNNPPTSVTDLALANTTDSTISLSWNEVSDDDIMGYLVYRKLKDAVEIKKVAMVYEPIFTDFGLNANTEYCYEVRAIDASDNIALSSNQGCDTTQTNQNLPPDTEVFPKGATFDRPQKIWLACFDRGGSGCAATYYTVDGAEPDTNSLVYSDPLELSETTTIKYFSLDNNGLQENIKTEEYIFNISSSGEPLTIAAPNGGNFNNSQQVWLNCFDNGSAGCATIFYTVDGSEPTTGSLVYNGPVTLSQNTTLKFASVDNDGVLEAAKTAEFTIALPTDPILEIVQNDTDGLITSEDGFISCGLDCSYLYDLDTIVTLTASHGDSLTAIWAGCESTEINKCTVTMNRARKVIVTFVSEVGEVESNEIFSEAQLIIDSSIITGYFNTTDDDDYYRIEVPDTVSTVTLYAKLSHNSVIGYFGLFDENHTRLTFDYNKTVNNWNYTLTPGTYYIQVTSHNHANFDVDNPYQLELSTQ